MSKLIAGCDIGLKVCNALGIDGSKVKSMKIEIPSDGFVTVTIEQLVLMDILGENEFVSVFESYNLTDKDSDRVTEEESE